MYAADWPSESATPAQRDATSLRRVRVDGGASVIFEDVAGATRPMRVGERDGYKLRFPKTHGGCEAVLINTGGGLAGGDRVAISAELRPGAEATITTPMSERVYKAKDDLSAEVSIDLTLAGDSALSWLPQEMILFDGARLCRDISVEMSACARLVIAETLVLGRTAMGETLVDGLLHDHWRIRRDGGLAFAESIRLGDDLSSWSQMTATTGDNPVIATIVLAAPDAEDRLDAVRERLGAFEGMAAASAWSGLQVIRAVTPNTEIARAIACAVVPLLSGRAVPRVWSN